MPSDRRQATSCPIMNVRHARNPPRRFRPHRPSPAGARARSRRDRRVRPGGDPQPFHLDEQAAAASIYGGLIASGWQPCARSCVCSRTACKRARRWARPGSTSCAGSSRCAPATASRRGSRCSRSGRRAQARSRHRPAALRHGQPAGRGGAELHRQRDVPPLAGCRVGLTWNAPAPRRSSRPAQA